MKRTLALAIITIAQTALLAAEPLFRVHTNLPGLDYVNISGTKDQLPIIEQNGQGVALLDFDNDGWVDLFVTNGGTRDRGRVNEHPGCRLYRNLGQWRFEDVTSQAGVAGHAWSNGCTAADYDQDGDMDLYVSNWGPNVLYRNNGDGTFSDVTAIADVADRRWSSSAVFADVDGDGRLDLYVSNYVSFDPEHIPSTESDGSACTYRGIVSGCGPWRYAGQRDTLYLQLPDGRFQDVSNSWGLACTAGFRGMGIAAGDFDADGDVDLYIGCDVMPNLHLENVDRKRFRSVGLIRGGALNAEGNHESGMGVAVADLFDRGWLDILTTNFAGEKNAYYRNNKGYFDDRSREVEFNKYKAELGWGIVVADFNQDGRRDVFVCNGHVYPQVDQLDDPSDRYAQSPRVYLGADGGKLVELSPVDAFAPPARPAARRNAPGAVAARRKPLAVPPVAFSLRSVAAGDLDNDGDIDLVAVQHNGPLVIFENRSNKPAAIITLRTSKGGLSPHGAHINVGAWHYFHWPAQGYQCSHDPRVIIAGIPTGIATVRWPDGTSQSFRLPKPGQAVVWQEGR